MQLSRPLGYLASPNPLSYAGAECRAGCGGHHGAQFGADDSAGYGHGAQYGVQYAAHSKPSQLPKTE